MSKLNQLRKMTVVVADTGDLDSVRRLKPYDCTTNPSIVLSALTATTSTSLLSDAILEMKRDDDVSAIARRLTVAIGAELTSIVPGRVSTEIDPRLSFDVKASIESAKQIVSEYAEKGISSNRILIKLAATWEGIRAAEQLQKDGIDCNLTLLFSMIQAKACADAGVFLISPFVGRITDWHKANSNTKNYTPDTDPGVQSVRQIYDYYKSSGIKTVVMGASFRNVDQIKALAGCDRLTISPKLLDELDAENGELKQMLSSDVGTYETHITNEPSFRWELNENTMASEKLSEGIRNFNSDTEKLLKLIAGRAKGK